MYIHSILRCPLFLVLNRYIWFYCIYTMSCIQCTCMCAYTHIQDMDELDVIGHAPHHPPNDLCDHSDDPLDSLGEEASYSEDSLSSDDNSHNK